MKNVEKYVLFVTKYIANVFCNQICDTNNIYLAEIYSTINPSKLRPPNSLSSLIRGFIPYLFLENSDS